MTLKPLKGVGVGHNFWRVCVRYKGDALARRVHYTDHASKERALAVANQISKDFHKRLGKPLQIYVATRARSSTGHIGISKLRTGWLVEVRGKGHPALRQTVPKRDGLKKAIALRQRMLRSLKPLRSLPPATLHPRKAPRKGVRNGDDTIHARAPQTPVTDGDLRALQAVLNADPTAGDLVPGAGGVRKVRATTKRRGKRRRARVIYYYISPSETIYLLLVYAKREWNEVKGAKRFKHLTKTLDAELR
jgi:hypothetical protein